MPHRTRASLGSPTPQRPRSGRASGFTLVELLVAISIMALLTLLSWRGLDGMARAQERTLRYADELLALQTGLAQWRTDLDAAVPWPRANSVASSAPPNVSPNTPPSVEPSPSAMDWNGLTLRLLRRGSGNASDALQVVAWSQREVDGRSQWLRWQSAALRTQGDLSSAWQQAALWGANPGAAERRNEVVIAPLQRWQLFYFRSDTWSTPQSSTNAATDQSLPDGVRLLLTLPAGQALVGGLSSDWVRPTVGGQKL